MALRKNKKLANPNKPLTLLDHLHELRFRVACSAAAFLAGGAVGYIFHLQIIEWVRRPLHQTLYFNTPAGNFNFIMSICMLTGLIAAIPVIAYNLIAFIQPALPSAVLGKKIRRMTLFSFVLAMCGMFFAYFVIIPASLRFFLGFNIAGIEAIITADSYLQFIISSLISFMVIFQIPLIMTIIDRIKPIPPSKLLKKERHVIVGSLVIALAQPFTYDPLTMFLIAAPMIVLYNLSIIMLYLAHRKRPAAMPMQTPLFRPAPKLSMVPSQALPQLSFITTANEPMLIQDVVRQTEQPSLHYQM